MKKHRLEKITIGRGDAKTEYTLAADLMGKPRDLLTDADDVVYDDERLDCVVVREDLPEDETEANPVFRVGKGEEFALPSGRIFVRMRDKQPLEDLEQQLDAAGFSIERINAWAPYSGWVVAKSGRIIRALENVSRISTDLNAHVEPEMITTRHYKPSTRR